jgi:cation-transporting P-type ATPase F
LEPTSLRQRNQEIPSGVQRILVAGALCNDSHIAEQNGIRKIQGDPTEAALLVSDQKGGNAIEELSRRLPRIDVIPFESDRRYMATLHTDYAAANNWIFLKGAVEKVMDLCHLQADVHGRDVLLDRETILRNTESLAARGYACSPLLKPAAT